MHLDCLQEVVEVQSKKNFFNKLPALGKDLPEMFLIPELYKRPDAINDFDNVRR